MAAVSFARQRIAAWVIDGLIFLGLGIAFGPIGWVVSAGYWLLRDGLFAGQSIGKRLMGLRVVTGPDRTPCTLTSSALRNVLWVIPVVNCVTGVTGLYYLFNDAPGRHWGDRLADTRVVKASQA